jgi:uncharacterized membrane protein YvlD (DUF360 family)
VVELIVRILINAVALLVAVKVVPQIVFKFGNDWWKVIAVALIFALVNSYIKPIVKALSFPISMLTLGLVAFVINAAMLLLLPSDSQRRRDHRSPHRGRRDQHRLDSRERRARAPEAPLGACRWREAAARSVRPSPIASR